MKGVGGCVGLLVVICGCGEASDPLVPDAGLVLVACERPAPPALDCSTPPTVDTASLLDEMIDLVALASPTCAPYRALETSSHDPRSRELSPPTSATDGWFANVDWGHYLGVERMPDGRDELVMLDVDGPGAIVKMWSANDDGGTLRVYFDGAADPAITADIVDLLSGEVAPFVGPFAQVTSFGGNLDFPLPFREHVRVTIERPGPSDYWTIAYRRYDDGVDVRSFDAAALSTEQLAAVTRRLRGGPAPTPDGALASVAAAPVARVVIPAAPGGSALVGLRVIPRDLGAAALRASTLSLAFDGRETVRVPLGDFFGVGPGFLPHRTLPLEVTSQGELISRFVMPFACDAVVTVASAAGASLEVRHRPLPFTAGGMHLHAHWTERDAVPTRPFRDLTVLDVAGAGRHVGTMISVDSRSREWWGEGDEKVWVDDDTFPSWFGTGTEDYFGYAYSKRVPFEHAYRTLRPTGDAYGQVSSARFHVLDAIPFRDGLRFDLELWHWDERATVGYDTLAWFYLSDD